MAKPEEALHMAVAAFLERALVPPAWFTTFPSGGGGRVRGAKLKRMGLKAGVPDILVIDYQPHADALKLLVVWIELKAKKGVVSLVQGDLHRRLRETGCFVEVCRSVEQVEDALRLSGVPLRASTRVKAA